MDYEGLEDLLLPEDKKDSFENFKSDVVYKEGDPTKDKNSKIFYLDDDHNMVDEKDATKAVIQVYDDNGNMIEEVWSYMNQDKQEDDNSVTTVTYVDEAGNEVKEDEATHIVYKTFVGDELVSEDKYPLNKSVTL